MWYLANKNCVLTKSVDFSYASKKTVGISIVLFPIETVSDMLNRCLMVSPVHSIALPPERDYEARSDRTRLVFETFFDPAPWRMFWWCRRLLKSEIFEELSGEFVWIWIYDNRNDQNLNIFWVKWMTIQLLLGKWSGWIVTGMTGNGFGETWPNISSIFRCVTYFRIFHSVFLSPGRGWPAFG